MADLGFSRGGGGGGGLFEGDFQKILTAFFFQVDQIDFSSSPKALFCPFYDKIFCAAGKILKKQSKSRFLALFEKKFWHFFWRALPLKVSIYWRQVSIYWYFLRNPFLADRP